MPTFNLNTNTISITGWINPAGPQVDWTGIVFCRGGTTIAGLNFGSGGANELRYTWNNDHYGTATGLYVPTYQWSFFALVVTPTNATIYLGNNGTLSSHTDAANLTSLAFDAPLVIGSDGSYLQRWFNGGIDEVALYNSALTPAQVGQLFTNSGDPPSTLTPFQTWQQAYFGCTACPQALPTADADGDGQNNQAEYLAGTDPTNGGWALRILNVVRQSNDVNVIWQTAGGHTNILQAAAGNGKGGYATNFNNISGLIILPGTGPVITNFVDAGAVTNGMGCYYRIRLGP
jgi:hypothetical protein